MEKRGIPSALFPEGFNEKAFTENGNLMFIFLRMSYILLLKQESEGEKRKAKFMKETTNEFRNKSRMKERKKKWKKRIRKRERSNTELV